MKTFRVIFLPLTPILDNITSLKKYINAWCVNYLWLFFIKILSAALCKAFIADLITYLFPDEYLTERLFGAE
jgi:hypothetical protein